MQGKYVVSAAFVLLALAAVAAEAPQTNLRLEGDTLADRPTPATAEGIPSCATAKKFTGYVAAHNFDKVGALFADDGILLPPIPGAILRGPEQIEKFFMEEAARVVVNNPTEVIPIQFAGSGNECFFELAFKSASEAHFEITSIHHTITGAGGKIVRDIVYVRPGAIMRLKSAGVIK